MKFGGALAVVRPVAAVAVTVLWCGHAGAKDLARPEIILLALSQNPQVRAVQADVAAAVAVSEQARAARWPMVSFTAGTGPALKATLAPGTAVESTKTAYGSIGLGDLSAFVSGDLEVLQPIFTFGKIGYREQAAQHQIAARRAQVEMTEADIASTAVMLYEGHLLARDARRFFEEAQLTIARVIEQTQEALKGGSTTVTQRDILELQVAEDAAELGLHEAQAREQQALAGLRAYLGLAATEPITVREDHLEPMVQEFPAVEQLRDTALSHRPEIAALRHGTLAYQQLARAEQAGSLPDVFALGVLSGAYTPDRDLVETRYVVDPLYHFVPALVVGLRWTWQSGMADSRAAEARSQADHLQALEQWAVAGLPAEVVKSTEDARQALLDIATATEGVDRAKKWVVLVVSDYAIGAADTRAVTEAVDGYTLMRLGYLDAIYRRNTGLAAVAKTIGTLVRQGVGPYRGKP